MDGFAFEGLELRQAVSAGKTVTATAEVIGLDGKRQRAALRTACRKAASDGEATVLPRRRR